MAIKIIYICDGCKKEVLAVQNKTAWAKPPDWFEREDEDGVQVACSRQCIQKVATDTGKSAVVAPGV